VNSDPRRLRAWRAAMAAALLLACLPAAARSTAEKKQAAEAQFERAEKLRQGLAEGKDHTRREYLRVIESYRRVYYLAPTSSKAEPSAAAVADLFAEMGANFDDHKASRDAIAQYQFLRREYPGSRHRVEALFAIARIYRDDLNDTARARLAYQDFLQHYPRSELAQQARTALADMEKPAVATRREAPPKESSAVVKSSGKEAQEEAEDSGGDDQPGGEKSAEKQLPAPVRSLSRRGRPALVIGIRHWSTPDYTRIAIDLEQQVKFESGRVPHPDRIYFDLHDTRLAPDLREKSFDIEDGFLRKIRVARYQRDLTRVVLDVDGASDYKAFLLPNPFRLIIDIHGKQPKKLVARGSESVSEPPTASSSPELAKVAAKSTKVGAGEHHSRKISDTASDQDPDASAAASKKDDDTVQVAKFEPPEVKPATKPTTAPALQPVAPGRNRKRPRQAKLDVAPSGHEAQPTSSGEQTLIRALGLKIGKIVVDAGHGGHDTGTIGPNGLLEKDLVLDVALRLGRLLERNMGADVVYTRDTDIFVPLESRTAIANKAQADLFISIHANSSHDSTSRGVETYYLNFTSSASALEVAARENATSDKSIHELQDLVKKIALKEKIEESREFAVDVQRSLQASPVGRGSRDRGVKKAPFVVLIGANMPSILAEISFLSNPDDEHKLSTPEYRQKIAEALYRGIAKYVSGLSGVKMATRMGKDSGQ
jgi:N-acetylmuramoyl-L-alanine amidase